MVNDSQKRQSPHAEASGHTSRDTIREILRTYKLSQTDFAKRFNIPLRTVQNWCGGRAECPPYVLAMASELLANNK